MALQVWCEGDTSPQSTSSALHVEGTAGVSRGMLQHAGLSEPNLALTLTLSLTTIITNTSCTLL